MGKNKIWANISVTPGYGYSVTLSDGTEYSAGDSQYDSQVYGTGDLSEETLEEYARQTAAEMMRERFGKVGQIVRVDNMFEGVGV